MRNTTVHGIGIMSCAALIAFGAACQMAAQGGAATSPATIYSKMAPVEEYLMADRDAEIALARTAAPASISGDAGVMVLGRHGFEMAAKGTNGFVCIVGRGWTAAADPDFWNPKVRVPMCVNAAAASSYLVRVRKETEWGLEGRTAAQINSAVAAGIASKELPAMEPGAMCYMMGKEGFGGDVAPHWPAHLMFFYTDTNPAIWGANLPGSPVIAVSDPVEHLTQFVIPVQRWADGTDVHEGAGAEHHH